VCAGRGVIVHHDPVVKHRQTQQPPQNERRRGRGGQQSSGTGGSGTAGSASNGNGHAAGATHAITDDAKNALAQIAASTMAAHANEHAEPAAGKHAAEPETAPEAESSPAVDDAPKKSRTRGGATNGTPSERELPAMEVPVTLLDIPVVAAPVNRRPKTKDAEQLLDSVLDALPQPKQPGQGRGRSRRVSTAAIAGGSVAPQITRIETEE